MTRVIVIKVYAADLKSVWNDIKDSELELLSHQEIPLESRTPRHIQLLMANLARFINERRIA